MKTLYALIQRNIKLFFKDKGMVIPSLITPIILLVLYATFLGNVYKDSFYMGLPEGVRVPNKLANGFVGGQLFSSLLAVSCVTVSFGANLLMVQDKVTGAIKDFTVTPVKKSTIALAYYIASFFSSMLICLVAIVACCIYLAFTGWYLSFLDIVWILFDGVLLVGFGTALSSIIHHFLSTQGQMSAVCTIVSAGYGFICGAYMPLSQFSTGLYNAVCFLPGTYATSLIRNHALSGVLEEMTAIGVPPQAVEGLKDAVDCNLYFFGNTVPVWVSGLILVLSVLLLTGVYVALHARKKKNNQKKFKNPIKNS